MDLKTSNASSIQAYVNKLENELKKPPSDIKSWDFFDVQDYVVDLEKAIIVKRQKR